MKWAMTVAVLLALAGCGGGSGDYDEAEFEDLSGYEGEEFAGETYDEYDERRDELDGERGTYAGYGCTVDCSGHEAGYDWAAENDITDPDNCGGKSWSFIEGCRAYAEEQGGY